MKAVLKLIALASIVTLTGCNAEAGLFELATNLESGAACNQSIFGLISISCQ